MGADLGWSDPTCDFMVTDCLCEWVYILNYIASMETLRAK